MAEALSLKRGVMSKSLLHATSACAALVLFMAPAEAQLAIKWPAHQSAACQWRCSRRRRPRLRPPPAPERTIQHIVVTGTQRVEQSTVGLTYVGLREGDSYNAADSDQALKTLYATGLFSDVRINFDPASATLTIAIVENPIVNQVVFEENSKVSDKDLTKEIQIKPRSVFTRAKVQADVERIVELLSPPGQIRRLRGPGNHPASPEPRGSDSFASMKAPPSGIARINFVAQQGV